MDLSRFREEHTPQTECGPCGWIVFIAWVISYANEWEDYSIYLGEGVEISRNWATTHSLVF